MDPTPTSPIQKAIRYAGLSIGAAILIFVGLIFVALYVPNNFFLNAENNSQLEQWMPDRGQLPADMLLVSDIVNKNEDVAKQSSDTKEMLARLEAFGREEGFAQEYRSKDRCQMLGPRMISISLVLHKSPTGAHDYWQWLLERDRIEAEKYQEAQVGQGGYLLWNTTDSLCAEGEKERELEISFHRNQFLVTVTVSAYREQNSPEELLAIGLGLANAIDDQMQHP